MEAIKGEKTIQDLAMLYHVHPNLVALWKKQVLEHAAVLFEKEGKDKEAEEAARKESEDCERYILGNSFPGRKKEPENIHTC